MLSGAAAISRPIKTGRSQRGRSQATVAIAPPTPTSIPITAGLALQSHPISGMASRHRTPNWRSCRELGDQLISMRLIAIAVLSLGLTQTRCRLQSTSPGVQVGGGGSCSKHLCNGECIGNQWEGEAPAELNTPWFGRSLTLPNKEWIGQSRGKHVTRGCLTPPDK